MRDDLGAEFDRGDCPLIAFVNAKSGGRVGPKLAQVLSRALGTSQVGGSSGEQGNEAV